jgi:LysR family hydrogen peroxide-inducible transcriptional activator
VEQAQRVLEQAESIKQIATEGKDQLSSPLHLGVIYTIGPYLLPHLIPLLHQQAPEMPIVIREDFTTNLSEALKRGELDIIILSQPYAEHGVTVRDLYDEPFVMAMPSGHPLSKKRSIKPDDISNETLLLLGTGNCFRDQVLEFCPNCNATGGALDSKLQKSLEGSSLETIRHMAASGAGVTVLPCTSAGDRTDLDGLLTTRPFAKPTPYRTVSLAYRTSFPRLKSVETLQQAIADCPLNCISNK